MIDPLHERWLAERRGIRADTLALFGVYSEDGVLVLPYPSAEKLRANLLGEVTERRTWWRPSGASRSLYGLGSTPDTRVAFLVEGETDCMRLAQALRDAGSPADVYGLSGMNWWVPEFVPLFHQYSTVYVVFDDDKHGAAYPDTPDVEKKVAQGNKAWAEIRSALGAKARRVYLTGQAKDLCEFFNTYHVEGTSAALDRLRQLARSSQHGAFNYKRLDLTGALRDYDWLVENWFAMQDVVLLFSEPGIGKSWLAMSLAAAVVKGEEQWLGHALPHGSGRVLYIDQENPEDVIHNRFRQLGVTDAQADNLLVYSNQMIRLPRDVDKLMNDIYIFNPSLIVFDSLTMSHSASENDSGEMATVFKDGFIHLARTSGACVIVIHHAIKGDSLGSFQKVRGSGAIPAACDFGLDVRKIEGSNTLKLLPYKPRRKQGASPLPVEIVDVDGGFTEVRVVPLPDTGL